MAYLYKQSCKLLCNFAAAWAAQLAPVLPCRLPDAASLLSAATAPALPHLVPRLIAFPPHAAPSADAAAAKPHLSKHAKKRLKEEREKAIRAAELQRLEGGAAPTSVTEFEQLVMTSPNASYVWVKYLAFLISLGELEKARALADRALSTINYRCVHLRRDPAAVLMCWRLVTWAAAAP